MTKYNVTQCFKMNVSLPFISQTLISDIVQLLLDHNVQLGDSLLRAVDEQFVQGVRLICEHIKKKNLPVRHSFSSSPHACCQILFCLLSGVY